MVPLRNPVADSCFEGLVGGGEQINTGAVQDFNIIEQAFSLPEHQQFKAVNRIAARPRRTKVQSSGRLNSCPGRLLGFIAISPVGRQAMVAVRIDKFQTASTSSG